ncbi:MAG: hypothetical protein ACRD2W_09640 [Acidimicrobiales bacterium]
MGGVEHGCGIDWKRGGIDLDLGQLTEPTEQRPCDPQTDLDALVVVEVGQRELDLLAEMPGDAVGRFC